MTIKPPVWQKHHRSYDHYYFHGACGHILEFWHDKSDGRWIINGWGVLTAKDTEQEARQAAEASYYQEMAKFVNPGIKVYVLTRWILDGSVVEGVFSTLELAKSNAAGREYPAGSYTILEVDVDDMSGPHWASHYVNE